MHHARLLIRASQGHAKRLVVKLPPLQSRPRNYWSNELLVCLDNRTALILETDRALGIVGKMQRVGNNQVGPGSIMMLKLGSELRCINWGLLLDVGFLNWEIVGSKALKLVASMPIKDATPEQVHHSRRDFNLILN